MKVGDSVVAVTVGAGVGLIVVVFVTMDKVVDSDVVGTGFVTVVFVLVSVGPRVVIMRVVGAIVIVDSSSSRRAVGDNVVVPVTVGAIVVAVDDLGLLESPFVGFPVGTVVVIVSSSKPGVGACVALPTTVGTTVNSGLFAGTVVMFENVGRSVGG